jgi:hypothetical protein
MPAQQQQCNGGSNGDSRGSSNNGKNGGSSGGKDNGGNSNGEGHRQKSILSSSKRNVGSGDRNSNGDGNGNKEALIIVWRYVKSSGEMESMVVACV